jgi:hypothetical protein
MNAHVFRPPAKSLIALFIVCALIRVGHWSVGSVKLYPDSNEYLAVARALATGDFDGYTGERPPGYPLFLLICRTDIHLVWWIQSILGIATSLVLFLIVYEHTRNELLSLISGLVPSLSVNTLLFESAILSETLSTFLLIMILWVLLRIVRNDNGSVIPYASLGILVAMSCLTRPIFLYLPLFLTVFFVLCWGFRLLSTRRAPLLLAVFLIPVLVSVGGWSAFNKSKVDYFGITTLLGYNLTQHSIRAIDDAPDDFDTLKQILLKTRREHEIRHESLAFSAFQARKEMMNATGLTVSGLSRRLTALAFCVFVRHPFVYAASVLKSWESFWETAIYWSPYRIDPRAARRFLEIYWTIEESILTALRLVFLMLACAWCVRFLAARISVRKQLSSLSWILGATVMTASFVQALLESGENARYAIPFQSLIVTVVLLQLTSHVQGGHKAEIPGTL